MILFISVLFNNLYLLTSLLSGYGRKLGVAECPLIQGCYTQGQTLDEALKNIHEVIELCLEEQKEEIVEQLDTIQEFSYHVVSVEV
jgi:predicted RNase H-like HicB family nuclease